MSGSVATLSPAAEAAGVPERAEAQLERVQALQSSIRRMQKQGLDERSLPTLPALAALLPGGALRTGSAYSVGDSHALVMAMLAGPSAAGSWCGVVGLPDFGMEAAGEFGIDPAHLVLVPHPGTQWLTVTAALADVLSVVVTRPPVRVSDTDAARFAARLRQRGSTLVVVGPWPQSDARLTIDASDWSGLGFGHGHLSRHEVTVTVTSAQGRPRSGRLRLPAAGSTTAAESARAAEASVYPLRSVV